MTATAFVTLVGAAGADTTMSTVSAPASEIVPKVHVTVPALSEQDPDVGSAETKVVPAGSVSVSVTPEAAVGPLLPTVIV